MAEGMTDQEVIATWMGGTKPKATDIRDYDQPKWWTAMFEFDAHSRVVPGSRIWTPRNLTLDALHEVEARLSDEQWRAYRKSAIRGGWYRDDWCVQHDHTTMFQSACHASAEQKITALASVLRPEVEPK